MLENTKFDKVAYCAVNYDNCNINILKLDYMDFGEGWNIPYHKHTYFEFHYILDGDAYTKFKDGENHYKKGDFYVMKPGNIHSHYQKENTSHRGFAMSWEFVNDNLASNLYKRLFNISHKMKKDNGEIYEQIQLLAKDIYDDKPLEIIKLEFCKILYLISEGDSGEVKEVVGKDFKANLIDQALVFMNENIQNNLTAVEIANAIHISYAHLNRLVKEQLGVSVKKVYRDMKIKKARELLNYTQKSIDQIAHECGFINSTYFYDIFKKYYDMTPSEYRKKNETILYTIKSE